MQVHQFEYDSRRLVFDVPTSRCFEVDEVMHDLLNCVSTHPQEEAVAALSSEHPHLAVREALSELVTLRGQGFLSEEAPRPTDAQQRPLVHLTLNVAHRCNLSCAYCFAGQGPYGGEASLMNKPTAQRAIDVFLAQPSIGEKLSITFFGGEPLLNVPMIEFVIAYANQEATKQGKQMSFTITTNGTLLSQRVVDLLKQHHVSMMVSIDGPKGIQDQLRRTRSRGKSSYDLIAARMKMLLQACPGHLTARATITHVNPDVSAVADHLKLMGFPRIYCAPVSHASGEHALDSADIGTVTEAYECLAEQFLVAARERQSFPYRGFNQYLSDVHRARRRAYACGAGRTMMAVTPEGDVYPCHRFVGMEAFRLGSVGESFDLARVNGRFVEATVWQRQGCASCWARYICGGHCLHEVAREDGSFGPPDPRLCDLYRKEIELALYLYASLQEDTDADGLRRGGDARLCGPSKHLMEDDACAAPPT